MKLHASVTALVLSFIVGLLPAAATESAPPGCAPHDRAAPEAEPARPVAPRSAGEPQRKENAAPNRGKQEAPFALDLASLKTRLRETRAIGFFTKLSLKNHVDDLLEQFRTFHEGRGRATLAELREKYNLLLLKVLSLLQDGDPLLACDISASREALWVLLADPAKFREL